MSKFKINLLLILSALSTDCFGMFRTASRRGVAAAKAAVEARAARSALAKVPRPLPGQDMHMAAMPIVSSVGTTRPSVLTARPTITRPLHARYFSTKPMSVGQARKELGFSPDEKLDKNIIKAAYSTKTLKAHPDTGGSNEAFQRLHAAYAVLLGSLASKPGRDPNDISMQKMFGDNIQDTNKALQVLIKAAKEQGKVVLRHRSYTKEQRESIKKMGLYSLNELYGLGKSGDRNPSQMGRFMLPYHYDQVYFRPVSEGEKHDKDSIYMLADADKTFVHNAEFRVIHEMPTAQAKYFYNESTLPVNEYLRRKATGEEILTLPDRPGQVLVKSMTTNKQPIWMPKNAPRKSEPGNVEVIFNPEVTIQPQSGHIPPEKLIFLEDFLAKPRKLASVQDIQQL